MEEITAPAIGGPAARAFLASSFALITIPVAPATSTAAYQGEDDSHQRVPVEQTTYTLRKLCFETPGGGVGSVRMWVPSEMSTSDALKELFAEYCRRGKG